MILIEVTFDIQDEFEEFASIFAKQVKIQGSSSDVWAQVYNLDLPKCLNRVHAIDSIPFDASDAFPKSWALFRNINDGSSLYPTQY